MAFRDEPLLIFDGACGTTLQGMGIPSSAWEGREGCNEYLNISAPDVIVEMHRSFLDAGAMVLETNTFGASRVVLAEYDLQDRVVEINHAAVENARRAIGAMPGRYIAGSVGPTTKLVSLGHIGLDALAAALQEQIRALVEAGVDAIIVETAQDLLQVKSAIIACLDAFAETGREVPICVSVTIEQQGTMLVGSDIAAVATTVEPFPVFSLGLNCATGPADMESHIRYLSRFWPRRISCIPNQGLPQVVNGQTCYPLSPGEYARHMANFVTHNGVSIVGGCCGTSPTHIRELVNAVSDLTPAKRDVRPPAAVSSLYQSVDLVQDPPPLLIGERANPNGSKKFRECLLADDFDGCLRIGLDQEAGGAQVLDLCAAYAGRDEHHDLLELQRRYVSSVKLPLVIDSTTPECIMQCLRRYPGRCMVNSINLEDGGANLHRNCSNIKRYGAAVIALTINEKGMAMTADEKVATARQIYDLAVGQHGLRPQDLLFDPLTFTVGSGDETLRDAAIQTLDGIRGIKRSLPGVMTVLGVSNISFGLPPKARKILNSVFLHEAIEAGLDAAIIDAGKIVPLAQISEEDRAMCLDLLYDRVKHPEKTPLMCFIDYFQGRAEDDESSAGDEADLRPEERLHTKIVKGDKDDLDDLLSILLQRRSAIDIINNVLVPAMRHVGELFGRGELLLPFVLQSAEVMKRSVTILEPYMEKAEGDDSAVKVLLATVQGDVHDIGKNLVDIILSNNGYKVYNIGIKVPAETIIEKAREYDVDVIGLSGLLVKSAIVMKESMPQYKEAGLTTPILLGGAALTEKFVAEDCVPSYNAPVVYCADAFAGLKAMREFEEGKLRATTYQPTGGPGQQPGPVNVDVIHDNEVPEPPFVGVRHVLDVNPAAIFDYVNVQALFRGRWGYRRAKMNKDEYAALITEKVEPMYEDLKRRSIEEGLIQPKVAYAYLRCYSTENTVYVEHDGKMYEFPFPRQAYPPHLCIADFYKTREEGGDIAGFFIVTIGDAIGHETKRLFEADAYHDYVALHGFSVEVTDALAEYWHEIMRQELGFGRTSPTDITGYVTQQYRGSRYGFGYPACPDLHAHEALFEFLDPGKIGVTLTENMEMVPEQTTSAIVAHHPQAKYFAV